MRRFISLLSATSIIAVQLSAAVPATAAPDDRRAAAARPAKPDRAAPSGRPAGNYARPVAKPARAEGANYAKPRPVANKAMPSAGKVRPAGGGYRPTTKTGNANRPAYKPGNANRPGYKPGNGNRPGGNNVVINNNNINVSNNNRYPNANRYPVYRPPGGGYYRPPNGGYYRPPPPPYGGWRGGYFPPPRYFYNDGPSVGEVLFGVAVTTSLLALLSRATQPDQQVVYVQGAPPPPLPAYVPPRNTTGAPAVINVDLNGLTAAQRPTASVCITEAARQIGATGGTEIRVKEVLDVEEGNGGYRFRLVLVGVYPDETRTIPMYCRATPDKIIELTFG